MPQWAYVLIRPPFDVSLTRIPFPVSLAFMLALSRGRAYSRNFERCRSSGNACQGNFPAHHRIVLQIFF